MIRLVLKGVLGSLGGVRQLFTQKEYLWAMGIVAVLMYGQFKERHGAREATRELEASIELARSEIAAEWSRRTAEAQAQTLTQLAKANQELDEFRQIVEEIKNEVPENSCTIDGDILEQLRIIQ